MLDGRREHRGAVVCGVEQVATDSGVVRVDRVLACAVVVNVEQMIPVIGVLVETLNGEVVLNSVWR